MLDPQQCPQKPHSNADSIRTCMWNKLPQDCSVQLDKNSTPECTINLCIKCGMWNTTVNVQDCSTLTCENASYTLVWSWMWSIIAHYFPLCSFRIGIDICYRSRIIFYVSVSASHFSVNVLYFRCVNSSKQNKPTFQLSFILQSTPTISFNYIHFTWYNQIGAYNASSFFIGLPQVSIKYSDTCEEGDKFARVKEYALISFQSRFRCLCQLFKICCLLHQHCKAKYIVNTWYNIFCKAGLVTE